MSSDVPFTPLIINGQERPSSDGSTFEVHTPQSGTLVGRAASASRDDCVAAIEAAAEAQKTWEATRLIDRRDIFLKAAELFDSEKYKKLLAQTNREEVAFTSAWSARDAGSGRAMLLAQIELMGKLRGETFESAGVPGGKILIQRRAKGVLFAIAPWNSPVALTARAIAVGIFCGNTVVLKGSELTPRTHYLVTKIFHEAGLPPGVLNCISVSTPDTPARVAEIIAHPLVRHINFTGSHRVGRIIAQEAAKVIKSCVLELGGKAPTIVLKDADLKEAAKAIIFGSMLNSGQICMSTERVIVHESIAPTLISSLKEIASKLKASDLTEASTAGGFQLGPLFSEASAERIIKTLQETQQAGAEVLLGDLTRDKNLIQPHILTGVKPGMKLWEEESFGPVVIVTTFKTEEEALELANASEYSLTSSVWTNDIDKAQEIAFRLRYGFVNINGLTIHSEPTDGVVGLSGLSGYGKFDIDHFTDKRATVFHPKGRPYPF